MRITFLVNYDLAATWALNRLLPRLTDHQVSVFYTRKPGKKDLPAPLAQLLAFEARALEELQSLSASGLCLDMQRIHLLGCEKVAMLNAVNDADFASLAGSAPDLIVSIRHMTILRETVYTLPKHGVINLHSGILPSYQGVMSSFWAMLNHEPQLGTTLHFIEDASIDTGAMIAQSRTAFNPEHSYLWNVLNLYHAGCELITGSIEKLANAQALAAKAQSGEANYFTFPTMEDFTRFEKLGYQLFDANDLADFDLGI